MIICRYILIICQHSLSLCIDRFRWAGRSRINMLSKYSVIKCHLLSILLKELLTFLWENYETVKLTTLGGLGHRDNLSLVLNTVHRLILVKMACWKMCCFFKCDVINQDNLTIFLLIYFQPFLVLFGT